MNDTPGASGKLKEPEVYHATVVQQNFESIQLLKQLAESSQQGHKVTAEKLDNMNRLIFTNLFKFPVALLIVASSTWMFYEQRITEHTWVVFVVISVSPWFAEWVPLMLRRWFKNIDDKTFKMVLWFLITLFALGLTASAATDVEYDLYTGRPISKLIKWSQVEDQRPFYIRVLWSMRPWLDTERNTRISYDWVREHSFLVEGGVGVGLKAHVDF